MNLAYTLRDYIVSNVLQHPVFVTITTKKIRMRQL